MVMLDHVLLLPSAGLLMYYIILYFAGYFAHNKTNYKTNEPANTQNQSSIVLLPRK